MFDNFTQLGYPDGKRYNSFVGYFKRRYGERLQKIVLDAGFSCPNRDGKVGRGGCTYCDNAAFHPSYSTAGKSLHQHLIEHRLSIAMDLLTATDYDIKTISWKTGFNSVSYFIKTFHAKLGMTPLEYRKRLL